MPTFCDQTLAHNPYLNRQTLIKTGERSGQQCSPSVVDPLYGLHLSVEDGDAGDGTEYLLLHALVLVLQAGNDGWPDEVSLGVFAGVAGLPAVDGGPVLPGQHDVAHHLLVVDLAVHRPAEGLLVQWISHTELAGLGHELLHEGLRNLSLKEDLKHRRSEAGSHTGSASDPAGTEADLSLVQEGGPDDSVDSILDVSVIEDHGSVLATKLQGDFLQRSRCELCYPLSHLGGA